MSLPLAAIETGVLNVFTDLPNAEIKVDGLWVAKESIVKLPLEVGEHYVQVYLEDQLIYAEKVTIQQNRTQTVVSDHFVDIITKTPSRGAIDRESARLRDSRGDFAFGLNTSSNLHSQIISFKWWAFERFGFQGLLAASDGGDRSLVGARFFASPADKIYEDQVLSGYVFWGLGEKYVADSSRLDAGTYLEFGINIEAYVGKLIRDAMVGRYRRGATVQVDVSSDSKSSSSSNYLESLLDLGVLVLTQIGHINFEVSLLQFPDQQLETNYTTGVHFYF